MQSNDIKLDKIIEYTQLGIDAARKSIEDDNRILVNGEYCSFSMDMLHTFTDCGTACCIAGFAGMIMGSVDSVYNSWRDLSEIEYDEHDTTTINDFWKYISLEDEIPDDDNDILDQAQALLDRVKVAYLILE